MLNQLIINFNNSTEKVSEKIHLKLNEGLSSTEDYKFQLLKTIISLLASSAIDVQLNVECKTTRDLTFVELLERIKDLNKSKQQGSEINSLLSPREKEVLSLILTGLTNHEIAEELFISFETVRSHRKNILSKTGSRNTASLVKFFPVSGL